MTELLHLDICPGSVFFLLCLKLKCAISAPISVTKWNCKNNDCFHTCLANNLYRLFWEVNKANTNYRRKLWTVHRRSVRFHSEQKILKMWMSCPRYRKLLFSWPGVATPVSWRQKSMDVLDFVKNLWSSKQTLKTTFAPFIPTAQIKHISILFARKQWRVFIAHGRKEKIGCWCRHLEIDFDGLNMFS